MSYVYTYIFFKYRPLIDIKGTNKATTIMAIDRSRRETQKLDHEPISRREDETMCSGKIRISYSTCEISLVKCENNNPDLPNLCQLLYGHSNQHSPMQILNNPRIKTIYGRTPRVVRKQTFRRRIGNPKTGWLGLIKVWSRISGISIIPIKIALWF